MLFFSSMNAFLALTSPEDLAPSSPISQRWPQLLFPQIFFVSCVALSGHQNQLLVDWHLLCSATTVDHLVCDDSIIIFNPCNVQCEFTCPTTFKVLRWCFP